MTVVKRPATLLDALQIADNLRDQDRHEVVASGGPDVRESLKASFTVSKEVFVWTLEDKPICIAGVSDCNGVGIPWMLGTDEMVRYSKMLVKDAGKYLEEKLLEYPCLCNFVHASNTRSIAWLKRLGFKFGHTTPEFGVGKQPFIFFFRYSTNV